MRKICYLFFLLVLNIAVSLAQTQEKKSYHTSRIEKAPEIDGDLKDECWTAGNWQGNFVQHEPRENAAPSQKTEFCLLYDNNYIYVAIKAYDTAMDSIDRRLSRRDQIDGDQVTVVFDSYHDLRTGFNFTVSAAGVKNDLIFSDDGNMEDPTWDPIWFVKTAIYDWGWVAEMKIPFTQLRFNATSTSVWGLEIGRQIFRFKELSLWQPVPRDASGFIHLIGELEGLDNLKPKKQLDLMPYVTGGYENYPKDEENPFSKGENWTKNIGLDGKVGITNNMTLDFTINPDFGQVEADPSEVNLTAFETFFQEKRPFFIEGKNITNFGIGLGDGDIGNDNLFYSRRIGRQPQRDLDLNDDEYADIPGHTAILGAAKLTGKTESGWSIGIIESLTRKELATIDYLGVRRKEVAEPMTNYFISRLQKDFNKGNTIIGGMYTNTLRDLDQSTRDDYHRLAQTAGIDVTQYFKDKNWMISVNTAISDVQGTANAITSTQESPVHYFQRPDASYIKYDPNRTHLTGNGGILSAGKVGGKWNFMFFGLWKSPGLELNDVGFLRASDQLLGIMWGAYHINKPFSIFRQMHFNSDYYSSWDYGLNYESSGYEFSVSTQLKNYWHFNFHTNINTNGNDKSMLRGGPTLKVSGESNFHFNVMSDDRKKLSAGMFAGFSVGYFNTHSSSNYNLSVNYKPINSLQIELEPGYFHRETQLQFIDNPDFEGQTRYIFASISQDVFSLSARINYSITPDFTIQFWGQPFAASGNFSNYKKITNNKASKYSDRYSIFNKDQIGYNSPDDQYLVDEDQNGTTDYIFDNPNFNSDEFLSNLVLRWEFVPGSTLYLVWSQKRHYDSSEGNFSFHGDMKNLFNDEKPYNVFQVKFSYRIGLR